MEDLFKLAELSATVYYAIDNSKMVEGGGTLYCRLGFERLKNYDLIADKEAFNNFLDDSRRTIAQMAGDDVSNVRIISKEEYDIYNPEDSDCKETVDDNL